MDIARQLRSGRIYFFLGPLFACCLLLLLLPRPAWEGKNIDPSRPFQLVLVVNMAPDVIDIVHIDESSRANFYRRLEEFRQTGTFELKSEDYAKLKGLLTISANTLSTRRNAKVVDGTQVYILSSQEGREAALLFNNDFPDVIREIIALLNSIKTSYEDVSWQDANSEIEDDFWKKISHIRF